METLRDVLEQASAHVPKYHAAFGLSRDVVCAISAQKNEPAWMREKRLSALDLFVTTPLPAWGPSLSALDLDAIAYYIRPDTEEAKSWDDVPQEIRATFESLGIPEAEREALGGVGAQYDSDIVYHNLKTELAEKGVIFENMDVAVHKYSDLVREYFMTSCVPPFDHKFAMLHAAVWSGGTFIYVPKNVDVDVPLQAYFRMNTKGGGQFEHTLILADESSSIHYIEGCSAPRFDKKALHAGCVEIHVKKNARVRYSSIENWSKNTYNLNTKRALVDEGGSIEWLSGNLGSGVTMLYPMSILRGKNAKSDYLGVAFAGPGQVQDTGAKVAHVAANTRSTVRAKSISVGGGQSTYRGLVKMTHGAENAMSSVVCDALMLDGASMSRTIPVVRSESPTGTISHEASVAKIGDKELGYLLTRGFSHVAAMRALVGGFLEPIVGNLPLEYAVELERLIELEMENASL